MTTDTPNAPDPDAKKRRLAQRYARAEGVDPEDMLRRLKIDRSEFSNLVRAFGWNTGAECYRARMTFDQAVSHFLANVRCAINGLLAEHGHPPRFDTAGPGIVTAHICRTVDHFLDAVTKSQNVDTDRAAPGNNTEQKT